MDKKELQNNKCPNAKPILCWDLHVWFHFFRSPKLKGPSKTRRAMRKANTLTAELRKFAFSRCLLGSGVDGAGRVLRLIV